MLTAKVSPPLLLFLPTLVPPFNTSAILDLISAKVSPLINKSFCGTKSSSEVCPAEVLHGIPHPSKKLHGCTGKCQSNVMYYLNGP